MFAPENVDPRFLHNEGAKGERGLSDWLNYDRHGAFFRFKDREFFACNDQSGPGATPFFRNFIICNVRYRSNGDIEPLEIRAQLKLPR